MVTETFTTDTDWTVPDGVFSATVTLEAEGGAGGSGGASGGNGGRVVGELPPLEPGELLGVRFLDGNTNGGAGCDIRRNGTALNDRVTSAGGGGAAGNAAGAGDGGDGGGLTAQNGSGKGPGGGGTQTAAGEGGTYFDGVNGSGGSGPIGGEGGQQGTVRGGGGGGSGYFGGGGVASGDDEGSGGGGASNYVDGLDTVTANEQGTSPRSPGDGALVTIEYPDPTPGAENLAITDTTATSNTLDWDAPTLPPEVDSLDQYRVYRATDPGTDRGDYAEVGTTPTPGFEDTGLDNGITYHYRVGADLFVPEAEGTITITDFRGV